MGNGVSSYPHDGRSPHNPHTPTCHSHAGGNPSPIPANHLRPICYFLRRCSSTSKTTLARIIEIKVNFQLTVLCSMICTAAGSTIILVSCSGLVFPQNLTLLRPASRRAAYLALLYTLTTTAVPHLSFPRKARLSEGAGQGDPTAVPIPIRSPCPTQSLPLLQASLSDKE